MILIGIALVVLALLGAPLFAIIAAGAMLGFYQDDVDLAAIPIEFYRIAETPVLLAIPLFTFAGYVLAKSNAPQRLVLLTDALIGWLPGGLAIVAIIACALFTALTGASGITIVALGALLYPALRQAGYPKDFNLGLVTTSGSLGLLFAPSLPLILYGVITQQLSVGRSVSIDDLFLAGILPGILMLASLAAYSMWINRGERRATPSLSKTARVSAIRDAAWEIPLPFIILGGIYGGYFAVSEAAAVTALYVLIVEVFIYREIKLTQLPHIVREAMVLVGGILIILGLSLASSNYLIDAEIPMRLFDYINEHVDSKLMFLLLLNLFLLILGTMLDIFSAIVLVVPLILPVAINYGVDPLHLGIVFLANMQLGYLTPPVGLNLFISSYRFEKPITEVYRATIPFFFLLLFTVIVITYWPDLSLILTR